MFEHFCLWGIINQLNAISGVDDKEEEVSEHSE